MSICEKKTNATQFSSATSTDKCIKLNQDCSTVISRRSMLQTFKASGMMHMELLNVNSVKLSIIYSYIILKNYTHTEVHPLVFVK